MIHLFVPGRLCLFGEHSDWAGKYRSMNSAIVPGTAIVTGIEQGIYATVEPCDQFRVTSSAAEIADGWQDFECQMKAKVLKDVAREGQFFSYCAGVASYMLEWYKVGGIHIHLTSMDLPMKRGLSSSAAICVLICRAFNQLYRLNLSTMGEMNIAYWGELRTQSRCGRLDQACAFGVNPVKMTFDGEDVSVEQFNISKPLYWVYANLNASKDTIRILADLNRAYPFAESDEDLAEQNALGPINQDIISRAVSCMRNGEAEALGALMTEAQTIFDKYIAPMCPSQLCSPKLHEILCDTMVKQLTFGGKGVGSQGDGSVQFIARNEKSQKELVSYLNGKGMSAYPLTIKPRHTVRKAMIPVAGFGTRLYPETRFLKKDFFPIIDHDGLVKPVILILLEECLAAGIEDICIVLGSEEEREQYRQFFETELPVDHLSKLPTEKQWYEKHILEVGKHLHFVYQTEKKGFGDAVYRCADFVGNDPVLLLLGDTLYKSHNGKCCALQLIEAYERYNKSMIAVSEVPLQKVSYYGIIHGKWVDGRQTVMEMSQMYEKPTVEYAEENLGMEMAGQGRKYYHVFGQYILKPEVFAQLKENIENGLFNSLGEVELTTALEQVRSANGMMGIRLEGEMFDMGIPDELRNTVANFGKN